MDHGEYKGEAYIYSHREVLNLIRDIAGKLLLKKEAVFIDDRLHLVEISDGQSLDIIGHKTTFFDIQSTKARQYGFRMEIKDGRMSGTYFSIILKTVILHAERRCIWRKGRSFTVGRYGFQMIWK